MQLLATADQMREFDRVAIERCGMPGIVLMENAGRGFVEALAERRPLVAGTRVAVVAGKGNNGGDGFVIARHLLNRGCAVDLLEVAPREALHGDARTNREILGRLPGGRFRAALIGAVAEAGAFTRPEIIVDALVGTGFTGSLLDLYADLAEWINGRGEGGAFVGAVDIPSGIDATSGALQGIAVKADLTVAMGLAKPGHFLGAGREHAGEVVVADLGIPREFLSPPQGAIQRITAGDAARWLPRRRWDAHKYSVGKVYVLGGSLAFTGAPCLAAEAALVAGAGAVVLGVPSSIQLTAAGKLAEVIVQPLQETVEGTVAAGARRRIQDRCAWADVVVIGPGMGRHPETDALVTDLVARLDRPLVLDADGLNAHVGRGGSLRTRHAETVLTPHAGELARLTGAAASSIEARRVEAAREAASAFGSTVVLKGAPTATAWREGGVVLNASGNAGMATIGSGDVLTGLLAGLWAQGMGAGEAAATAVYVHGLAGDEARRRLGERSLRATDILRAIPGALLSLEGT
jgi:NAD(P)H-hydrate epimerase